MQYLRKHYKLIAVYSLFALAYVLHAFQSGANPELQARYNISASQATALLLTIAIPYIAIWFTALLGYLKLRDYARSIRKTRDGQGFWQMSGGVCWLVLWLPVTSLAGIVATWLGERYPAHLALSEYADMYLGTYMLIVGFYFLNEGSKKMLRLTTKSKVYDWLPKLMTTGFLLLAGLYVFLSLQNPDAVSGSSTGQALPTWVLMNTVVLPRLLGWYLGLQAVWHLYLYAKYVSGRIYRLAFNYLATGLGVVVLGIILLGYLSTMSSITESGLLPILGAIYFLLILISAGYMLVTRGSNELNRIEQV